MKEQNYKNHSRLLPFWHGLVPLLLLAGLTGSIINVVNTEPSNYYSASLIVLIMVILIILYWYCRLFALRAQDRAIRSEERLRHYLLTGQPLDPKLRMGQIIALRFASDEEYPGLIKRALAENLSQKEIKQAIRNWKPDFNRV